MATADNSDSANVVGEDITEILPLTAAQRGMWFADTLSPDYSVNIAQYVDDVMGNWSALTGALTMPASVVHSNKIWVLRMLYGNL